MTGIILSAMADDGPLGHVDHILGDVGGKVADALQVAGDQEEVNEGLYLLWVFFNITLDVKEYLLVEGINLIVGGAYLLGHTGVHLYERIQSLLYHGYDLLTHFREIEKKLSPLPVSKIGGHSAMLTDRSPMRSRSLFIFRIPTTYLKSMAAGW